MWIKICGIKDLDTAHLAIEAGAQALGFVFAPSLRRIIPAEARKIIQNLPKDIWRVGVFVNSPKSFVKEITEYCHLTTLQFHGEESIDYCRQFKKPIIRAIKVNKNGQFFPDPVRYKKWVKMFLTDTYQPGIAGGTGKTFPWEKIETIKEYGLVILAGGLNSDNIFQALNTTRPWGVDVSSGVETKGLKDGKKISKFIQEVRRWGNEPDISR